MTKTEFSAYAYAARNADPHYYCGEIDGEALRAHVAAMIERERVKREEAMNRRRYAAWAARWRASEGYWPGGPLGLEDLP